MAKAPRGYPNTLPSPESGRPMTRGEKLLTISAGGKSFHYLQPGWWCSLENPEDLDGQLVDEDNQIAEMARRTAKVLANGERVFVPIVIRAIRLRCGLTQREAGLVFGAGEKSFEKYESGEIQPSEPTKRLLRLAWERPELFSSAKEQRDDRLGDTALVHDALRAAKLDRFFEPLFVAG